MDSRGLPVAEVPMPAAPVTMSADPVAATRRKLARLLAVGALRAAAARGGRAEDEVAPPKEKGGG